MATDQQHESILDTYGVLTGSQVRRDLPTPQLYERALQRHEAILAHQGPLVVETGDETEHSVTDRFIVREPSSEGVVWWSGRNQAMSAASFERIRDRLFSYLQGRELFVQDCVAGAGSTEPMSMRVVTETAWHSLFIRTLFAPYPGSAGQQQLTVIHAPNFHTVPALDWTRSTAFVALHLGEGLMLVGGTAYAGDLRSSLFAALTYLLPRRQVLPLVGSLAPAGTSGTALVLGPSRGDGGLLDEYWHGLPVADDRLGWSDDGLGDLESGCYASLVGRSPTTDPEFCDATQRFGAILENVAFDPSTSRVDLSDDALKETTRTAFPMKVFSRPIAAQRGHPSALVMLTADVFGVLPPVARLTPEQAIFHFLSGYAGGTDEQRGVLLLPRAIFDACFASSLLAMPPPVYARLLSDRVARCGAPVWLVNAGWVGGPIGLGHRIPIATTRALIHAATSGQLDGASMRIDPVFGFAVPGACPEVPASLLDPRAAWPDKTSYDASAHALADAFARNFGQYTGALGTDARPAEQPTA